MADEAGTARRPWHLWAVGVVSLLWNAIGVFDFVMTKSHNPQYLAPFTPQQIAWFDGFPLGANAAWAVGVWGALAASLLLLARSRWAVEAFALSLAGLIVSTVYQHGMTVIPPGLDTTPARIFTAILWLIAILLLWYAARTRTRGVLR